MSKLTSFATFLSVAEHSSFSRAAESLRKSPSAVTKIITQLEAELGAQLFVRDTRHTMLTEAGKLYIETIRGIFESLKNTEEEVTQLRSEISGSLRIAAPIAYSRAFLEDACALFQSKHPKIQLIIHLLDTPISLNEGGYDLALRDGNTDSYIARPVGRNQLYICASPLYLEKLSTPVTIERLGELDWMSFSNPTINKEYFELHDGAISHKIWPNVKTKIISNNYDFLLAQAIRGRALLIVPQWCANPLIKKGELVKILPEYEIHPNPFGSHIIGVYPEHRRASRKVSAFLDHLQTYLEENDLH
ncbi:LysR family transcriptional regulator [Pseudomonas sp. RIT-To-2]|uniref:LysR family transcriptional regulator n=1 Tax=Pseudomonas sp. RIT-To-2 TaxID=3462541 RepID=UPI0024134BF9